MAWDQEQNGWEAGSTQLVPLDKNAIDSVRRMEPEMPVDMISQLFHMQPIKEKGKETGKFKLVIDKAGLNWKMDKLYRGRYNLKTDIIMGDEYEFIKTQCLGFKKEDRVIICKSTLAIEVAEGKEKTFTAYGTATPANVKKGQKHPLELAETRAEKRVLQKATGCGFSAADNDEFEPIGGSITADTEQLKEDQRKKMWAMLRDAGLPDKDREGRLKLISQILNKKIDTTKSLSYADYLNINSALENGFTSGNVIDGDYTVKDDEDPPPPERLSEDQLNQITNLYIEVKWDAEKQEKYFSYMREKNPGIFTATSEKDFSPEGAEKFISFLKKKIVEADKKAMEAATPPTAEARQENISENIEPPIIAPEERHAHVPASYAQISEADGLFQKLEYDWQKKLNFFAKYRHDTGETYVKSVKDMDFIKAGLLIDHLKKELAEKHKMENGQFPGGVTEEENEAEKQDIRDNTIPTSEKMQDMFDGDVPF